MVTIVSVGFPKSPGGNPFTKLFLIVGPLEAFLCKPRNGPAS